ncbi:MAG TPA: hypothetical protein DCR93_00500, partial [Cytophagales bacterium]|nr:hypothetical protein [Cytophagales bacterium]
MPTNTPTPPAVEHKPGTLITARGREWIVLPQEHKDDQVLMVKPLGGTDAEKTGLLTPLEGENI